MKLKWYDIAHFLMGVATGVLNNYNPLFSLQAVLLFSIYEFLEQMRIWDKSYRDVFCFGLGWATGLALALWKQGV